MRCIWLLCGALSLAPGAPHARAQGTAGKLAPQSLQPAQVARASIAAGMDSAPSVARPASAAEDDGVQSAFKDIEGRHELKLERKDDGSFVYTGRGFTARIDAHGGLSIADKFSRAQLVVAPTPLDEIRWTTYFLRVTFDLLARLDKAFGNDPFRSERREFLEQTRDLRMALLERNAQRTLERALRVIWTAASSSPRQKRTATFELWATCSEDAYGDKVRKRIEAYVRERCPPGSVCEYTPQELARLNATRGSQPAFAPYAAP